LPTIISKRTFSPDALTRHFQISRLLVGNKSCAVNGKICGFEVLVIF
jgi:hypothetical protein